MAKCLISPSLIRRTSCEIEIRARVRVCACVCVALGLFSKRIAGAGSRQPADRIIFNIGDGDGFPELYNSSAWSGKAAR
jgi:hypothetical protein